MESTSSKEEIEKLWKWIERPLPPDFFTPKENVTTEDIQKRIDEIPKEYRRLAHLMYELALWHHEKHRDGKFPGSCCEFRQLLFILVKKTKEEYPLPYYWYTDGVMIEPEWIVRLTNGLIKWTCDSSKRECGLWGQCRFSGWVGK